MSMNKWLWGGLGWALGGPIGGIMGYAIASMGESQSRRAHSRGGDFGAAMMVLFAAVMKADGELKKTELEFVKRFLIENFGKQYAKERIQLFKKILEQDINVQKICSQIRQHMNAHEKRQLIHILFGLSKADNDVHKSEINIIGNISNSIGFNANDLNSIKAMFVPNTDAAYQILGVPSTASDSEVKAAYRKMATKYHPDKVSHLGDDFSKVAEEKFKAINDAYQKIKKERSI